MNTEKFTSLLANPQNINDTDLSDLKAVVNKYPYFQSARALALKALHNRDSYLYNDALKVTAAYFVDSLKASERFVQNEISQLIKQHDAATIALEVVSEDVSEEVSLEIDRQLKAELKKAEAILNPKLFERKLESVEEILENAATHEKRSSEEINAAIWEATSEKTPEETLAVDKPIPFTQKDTHSFSEWLKLTQAKPIKREEIAASSEAISKDTSADQEEKETQDSSQEERDRKFALIEKFIQDRPKVLPKDQRAPQENLAAPYTQGSDTLMTETLATVYVQQKNYTKAIQAYKILILKNPEKSGFFADRIRAIKKLIQAE